MVVDIPIDSEPIEEVPDTPTAQVDEFNVEEGNPKGFPSRTKNPKPAKEVKDNGNEPKDPSPRRRP